LAGDFEGALEQYHHTLEVEPEFVDTHGEIAWLYWDKLEQMDEAVRWFERALEIDPENEALLYRLMELYLDLSDIRSAEATQQRLADLQDGLARQSLSTLHNYREEFDQAVEVSREALARNPTDPSATYFLGNALMLSGRTQEALDLYQTYQPALFGDPPQKIDSRIDRLSLNIAAALVANGEEDAAQYFIDGSSAVLATGVRHAPMHFDLAFDIADVENLAMRGETEEALARLRIAIDEGWRNRWWWLKYRPTLASIRDHPEFQAMVAELEADAAMQRERLESSRAAN
jgi:tetratricopeptide (TPR) repeat protein